MKALVARELDAWRLPARVLNAIPGVRAFKLGGCAVLVSRDEVPGLVVTLRWHISVSHATRFPTWEEIGAARDQLAPAEVCFCIPFPPRAWWLSIHPNCFHLWEIADRSLTDLWRADGEQARAAGFGRPQPERRGAL